jgi:DNA-binding GntR family transcriptional regulator
VKTRRDPADTPSNTNPLSRKEGQDLRNSNGWSLFSTLSSASLPERIAETLLAAIVGGRLKPAEQIVESRVARQMGVGQNAVREALHALEFQGFVKKVPNIGTFITRLSRHRMRMELEALAVYWAREKDRPNRDDLEGINRHLDACAAAARGGDYAAYASADTEFHRSVWKLAGNGCLEKCLELIAVPQLSGALYDSNGPLQLDLNALVRQHREWIEVIRSKPPRLAYIYTRNLISSFWGQVEKAISGSAERGSESTLSAAGAGLR